MLKGVLNRADKVEAALEDGTREHREAVDLRTRRRQRERQILRDLARGESVRVVVRRYNVPTSTVYRYRAAQSRSANAEAL